MSEFKIKPYQNFGFVKHIAYSMTLIQPAGNSVWEESK